MVSQLTIVLQLPYEFYLKQKTVEANQTKLLGIN